MINRRTLIGGACGAVALGGLTAASGLMRPPPPPVKPDGLRRHAARRGMSFGCMVFAPQIGVDEALMKAVVAEADTLVPGIELKWGVTEKKRGRPDYSGADTIAAFAAGHGLRLRGHAGFWYRNIPGWSVSLLTGPDASSLIVARVGEVVRRYRGRVFEWDVVNEAIEPTDNLPNGMRRAPFLHATDYGWIADCFHAAHEADPTARLFYNEYSLENDIKRDADRRAAVLALLTELKRRGAPIHGLGLQTHLGVGQRFSAPVYRTFLREVAALGIGMRITEFDVNSQGPDDIAARDQAVADQAARVLETAFDEKAMQGMLCWGLSDGYAGLGPKAPVFGPTRIVQRGLPLDADLQRKPLWATIARAFDGAPAR